MVVVYEGNSYAIHTKRVGFVNPHHKHNNYTTLHFPFSPTPVEREFSNSDVLRYAEDIQDSREPSEHPQRIEKVNPHSNLIRFIVFSFGPGVFAL